MQVQNAIQIKNNGSRKGVRDGFNSFTQPIQFLPLDQKDGDWAIHNLDWLEWQGVKQISQNARRLMKNYKLAVGTIDREDYIPNQEINENSELLDILDSDYVGEQNNDSAFDLKFYPIIPNVINVLTSEFAKRNTKIDYRAIDEHSYSEIFEKKKSDIEAVLLEDAQVKLIERMVEMGMDPNDPEAQEQLDPEALKRLPEIEDFYSKEYQTLGEQWAVKQHAIDMERFKMEELEEIAFRDMLITDREFWHFLMYEDDYEVELWNPVLTFYHKSPSVRYISQASWVGKIDMLTISDVIDIYGPRLTQSQLESLEGMHPVRAGRYLLDGVQNDGSYYNPAISHNDNLDPSLQMKQWQSFNTNGYNADDVISWIIGQGEHGSSMFNDQMLRVTTAYWKTQRKIGYLTSIDEGGQKHIAVIDENYVIANNPIYHTKFTKERNAETLVFGDHIEWLWINQTYGGVKIGPNRMSFQGTTDRDEFTPLYIGIDKNEIGPLRFQFKGDDSIYGSKVPVEGKIFTERNSKSTAPVDLMKSAQVGFNMVNNQIADILIDEIGTVVALDQNALPQKSLGEDWGKGNYAKAYVAMKDFSILPLDTSLMNTENALNFQHYQTLNLEQSNRLMTRIQLANYFKTQALEVIGMTPQRMGQQMGQTSTATEVEQSVAGSYAQTEMYFIQHSDYLMPRVHQMRTDLAQFYHSNKSSVRLQGLVSPDERKFFEINGTDLLLIDINVFARTSANHRSIIERIQNIVATNNTMGASIYDLSQVMEVDSLGTLNSKLKAVEEKQARQAEEEHARAKELADMEIKAKEQELKLANDHEKLLLEMKNRKDLMVAEIRAAGFGAMQDINENKQSDFIDAMESIRSRDEYSETMTFKKEQESNKMDLSKRKLDLEERKIEQAREKSDTDLKIARENQTKAEIDSRKNKKFRE